LAVCALDQFCAEVIKRFTKKNAQENLEKYHGIKKIKKLCVE